MIHKTVYYSKENIKKGFILNSAPILNVDIFVNNESNIVNAFFIRNSTLENTILINRCGILFNGGTIIESESDKFIPNSMVKFKSDLERFKNNKQNSNVYFQTEFDYIERRLFKIDYDKSTPETRKTIYEIVLKLIN